MFNNDYSKITSSLYNDDKSKDLEYSGFFRAFVVNNNDPERMGRVQVRVPCFDGLEGEKYYVPNKMLSWAWPGSMNCAANNMGQYLVPEPGTVVWVTFEYGTHDYIYFGGILAHKSKKITKKLDPGRNVNGGKWYDINTDDIPTEVRNQAQKIIYKSPKGATIIIDDSDYNESISIVDCTNQKITMVNKSDSILSRRGINTKPKSSGYIELSRGDKEYIKLEEDKITIKAKEIVYTGELKKGE